MDKNLEVTVRKVRDIAIVDLLGYLDFNTIPTFKEELGKIDSGGIQKIILNFCDVSFMASWAFGTLLVMQERIKKTDGRLIIYGLRPEINDIFMSLGFSEFFTIVECEDKAILEANKNR